MPLRAPHVCSCGSIVAHGDLCACQQRRRGEADARRPNARQRGYTTKWEHERADFLRLHPRCAMCGKPATVVDHIVLHRGDMKLFWRRSNWQSLCEFDHNSTKQRQELAQ